MDALRECAGKFQRLLSYEYVIVAGSKGKLLELTLNFSAEQFPHLIGLHKLKDLSNKRLNYSKIFQMILDGIITNDDLLKSQYYDEIKERLSLFPILETILDSNELIIRYNSGHIRGTFVDAEYLVAYPCLDKIVHYFLTRDKETGKYIGKSFFGRDDDKYINGQQRFKILKKTKVNTITGNEEIMIDILSKK